MPKMKQAPEKEAATTVEFEELLEPAAQADPWQSQVDALESNTPDGAKELAPLMARYEFAAPRRGPAPPKTAVRPSFPAAEEVTNHAVAEQMRGVLSDINRNGETPHNKASRAELKQKLQAQLTRVRAVKDFLNARPNLDLTKADAVREELIQERDRLQTVHDAAMTAALKATHTQRRALTSLLAQLELTRCDGQVAHLFWVNVDPITTADTKARKEYSFKDLPKEQFIGESRPLLESSVGKNNKPYLITFISLKQQFVFQTRGTLLVLGADFNGLLDLEWWASWANRAGAVALANCSPDMLGSEPWTAKTAAALRNTYTSANPAMKSLVVCGNHPVVHPAQGWEKKPVTAYPSLIYAGQLYGNEYGRADLCFTVPPVNPVRDRLLGSWFTGELICPTLRNRRSELAAVPLALLVEVANERNDGVNVVFNTSRTAWSGGEHSCELELGTNLARAVIQHWMLMKHGCDLTKDEAEAIGRELNLLFRSLASSTAKNKPFLEASCDSTKSRIEDQIARNDDGDPLLDAKSKPVLTGKQVMIHEISIKFREGAENFEIHYVP